MTFCPRCGHTVTSAHCTHCGAPAQAPQDATVLRPHPPAPASPVAPVAAPRSGSTLVLTAIVASAVVLVAVVGALAVVLSRGGGARSPETAAPAAATVPAETPAAEEATAPTPAAPTATATVTETARPAPTPRATNPGDVRDQPAGLLCRDLAGQGFSYSAAVDYYRAHGNTDSMDADRNGIPCETVYSPADVSSYWSRPDVELPETYAGDVGALPGGLLCRDLRAQGYDYDDAAAYYYRWGSPTQMDADGNSIPCETVYPAQEVDAYWYG